MSNPVSVSIIEAYVCNGRNSYVRDIDDADPIKHNTLYSHTMAIPLHRRTLDIPVFMTDSWISTWEAAYEGTKYDYLSIPLVHFHGRICHDNSMANNIKKCFEHNLHAGLFSVYAKPCHELYYVTRGAIFDKNFNPMLVQSWRFSKDMEWDMDTEQNKCVLKSETLHLECPCMWIDPDILDKSDTMRKFIASKFLATAGMIVYIPGSIRSIHNISIDNNCLSMPLRVILDKWPYPLKRVATPSVSTTNESLIQCVLDNLDDIPNDC